MIRPSGFSPTRALARQFALCRKCPRGFEGAVVLLWKEIPVCQSCYIKELEAWNAKLNEIHGQQTKPNPSADGKTSDASRHDGSGRSPEDSACIPVRDKPADTSQETDGGKRDTSPTNSSRPGIQSQGKDEQASSTALKSKSNKRDGSSSLDIQSQDGVSGNAPQATSNQDSAFEHPDTHSSRETDSSASKSSEGLKALGKTEMSRTVDTQSQDCHNRKAGEVDAPLTLRGPDIDDGKVGA